MSFKNSSCILSTDPLPDVCFADMLTQTVACLFMLLIPPLQTESLLLDEVQVTLWLLIVC